MAVILRWFEHDCKYGCTAGTKTMACYNQIVVTVGIILVISQDIGDNFLSVDVIVYPF